MCFVKNDSMDYRGWGRCNVGLQGFSRLVPDWATVVGDLVQCIYGSLFGYGCCAGRVSFGMDRLGLVALASDCSLLGHIGEEGLGGELDKAFRITMLLSRFRGYISVRISVCQSLQNRYARKTKDCISGHLVKIRI